MLFESETCELAWFLRVCVQFDTSHSNASATLSKALGLPASLPWRLVISSVALNLELML